MGGALFVGHLGEFALPQQWLRYCYVSVVGLAMREIGGCSFPAMLRFDRTAKETRLWPMIASELHFMRIERDASCEFDRV